MFASFWALFVTMPGSNAINFVSYAMPYSLRHGLIFITAILTQAALFLTFSAFDITALITTLPLAFLVLKCIGAGFFFYIGIRSLRNAGQPKVTLVPKPGHPHLKSFMIETIDPKSVAR